MYEERRKYSKNEESSNILYHIQHLQMLNELKVWAFLWEVDVQKPAAEYHAKCIENRDKCIR